MPQKTTILKHIRLTLLTILFLVAGLQINAQKIKIDGVAVVIGKNIVLDSDIEKFKQEIELRSEGKATISDCEMLEELMKQKLIAHHAIIDSVVVSDAEVASNVDRNIQYFTQQYGGDVDKVVEIYGFNDIEDLKKEMTRVETENLLIQREQQKITEKIDVTPEEIRLYFNGLEEKGELPEFPAEVELAQIVVNVVPTDEEKKRVVEKLKEIKKDIEDGSSFRLKAIINSDDPGVTKNGGEYTVTKESAFIKEFKEMAFSLDVGQISEPFESSFGYHIMQLQQIKGNTRVASHILMTPSIPDSKLKLAKAKVDDIIQEIKSKDITFKEAVKKYSNDVITKNSEGLIINQNTGETHFDLTRMDPALYARVSDLKKGEMTETYYDEDREGNKMFKFILMKDRIDTHTADLVKDYEKIQKLALQKKQEETITKWSKEKIIDTYIKLGEEHEKCTFERNWKKSTNK